MATNSYVESADERLEGLSGSGGGSSRSGGGSSRGSSGSRGGGGNSALSKMASNVSADTILDLVQRLGVMDLVVDKLRGRLEEVDIDEILDEVGDYLRRNPEVVVVALGTITVMAGVLVYIGRRADDDYESERTSSRSSGSSSRSTSGGSKSGSSKSGGSSRNR